MTQLERIPSLIAISVDTREALPFSFSNILADKTYVASTPVRRFLKERGWSLDADYLLDVPTVSVALPQGDYCLHDVINNRTLFNEVIVERKSADDLLSSITHERSRLEREFQRIQHECKAGWLVCEALEHQVALIAKERGTDPKILTRTRISWSYKYQKVHWVFMRSRDAAATFTYRALELWHRKRAEFAR